MSHLLEVPKHSLKVCERFFGKNANGQAAQELFSTNPAEYRAVRASSEQHGLIGPPPRSGSPLVRLVQDAEAREEAKGNFSSEEVKARALFSKADCEAIFSGKGKEPGDRDNAGALKKDYPEKYRLAKIAAISHGVLPAQPFPAPISAIAPQPDGKITISDSLAADLNLPVGTRVEAERLSEFIAIASEVKAAKTASGEKE